MERLKRAGVKFTSWGAAGPDFMLAHNRAMIEVKRDESVSLVTEAYNELFARTQGRFSPSNAAWVGVITPTTVRIWWNSHGRYAPVDKPDVVFTATEVRQVVDYFKKSTPAPKLPLDANLEPVVSLIYSGACPDPWNAIIALLHLHKPATITNGCIFFGAGTPDERQLVVSPAAREFIERELINKYAVSNPKGVRTHLRHCWSRYQPDSKKMGLGKYYTPEHLVRAVRLLLEWVLEAHPKAYVADLAAGCGAFLSGFQDYRILGRDIDPNAVAILQEMGFENISQDNSLAQISRGKLGLRAGADLICVGNPPWNDTSSLNKRYSTDKKEPLNLEIDPDVKRKDLGISFLRAYAKLEPTAICVLHPLSYLIKPTNFRSLGDFSMHYRLMDAFLFSSAEFGEAIHGKTAFPVVGALYEPGRMDFQHIRNFVFRTWETRGGRFEATGDSLLLSNIITIDDGRIRKYPPTRGMAKRADTGLYLYNIRDTNSLLTSGAITVNTDENRVPIQSADLWKYCYLNCMKRYFGNSYIFGNLSPIYDPEDFRQEWFQDACVIDTIMNQQHLAPFTRGTKGTMVATLQIINDARRKAKAPNLLPDGVPNFYQAFVGFWDAGEATQDVLMEWWTAYFEGLRASMLG